MTEEDFRIDVLGSPKSPWNQSAARVFTRFFIDENDFPPTLEVHTAIRNAVTAHIETIIRRYKQSHKSQPERLLYRSMDRRQSRKYKLFYRRRRVAYAFEPLRRQIPMLEYLGVDGMSSDDSEREDRPDHPFQYSIRPPRWRATRVEPWLRMFDSIHNILRRKSAGTHPGAFPRIRTATNRKSANTKFVAGLPANAYDPQWMNEDVLRKYDIHAVSNYDFVHDEDVILYAVNNLHSFPLLTHLCQVGHTPIVSVFRPYTVRTYRRQRLEDRDTPVACF
ncbi:hypothetical protein C8F04DRAFT_959921 [Mycena alexandri]|uniref:Uncharacterized protein n=1 Tax=Mycena alexandri TaxID=1745969 RepID=A0AAD6SH37_9AGAR|nr:hypothetical protein C8F04DRAFT_972991 [Mycena alexandri]KAJ7026005.1 hypothetical protein C8F04DRAFT_966971 [Mycena alexandri]KAJ7031760.1 hypothetical protein C8F04DRAFT_959921 [Mycena alexandri]